MRTRSLFAAAAVTAGLAVTAACGSTKSDQSGDSTSMKGMSMPSEGTTSGMAMPAGNGLSATTNGYTLTVHQSPMAGMRMPITFTISKGGTPVTGFDAEQTKLMHLYLIRDDLSGFQHLHPTMAADGIWRATSSTLVAGTYRAYVQFVPQADAADGALVLSRPFTVAGTPVATSPATVPSGRGTVDGYTMTVTGTPKAGTDTPLTITITKNGAQVTDLQPCLDTYAHVTAIRVGDLAFAHLHPQGTASGAHGGPALTVNADLAEAGTYRMFIQFQTGDVLHTAAVTITAR